MYVHMHVCIIAFMNMSCLHVDMYVHVCMYVYMHVCVHACIYEFIHLGMYVSRHK